MTYAMEICDKEDEKKDKLEKKKASELKKNSGLLSGIGIDKDSLLAANLLFLMIVLLLTFFLKDQAYSYMFGAPGKA